MSSLRSQRLESFQGIGLENFDIPLSIMRVSAEKELDQCARETRIIEDTHQIDP